MASGYKAMNSQPPAARQDPFYVVKGKVQSLSSQLKNEFGEWKNMVESEDDYNHARATELSRAVKQHTVTINAYINDLAKTISIVEAKRVHFPHIDEQELDSRRRFVNDMRALSGTCESTLNDPRTKRRIESHQRKTLFSRPTASSPGDSGAFGDSLLEVQARKTYEEEEEEIFNDMQGALEQLGGVASSINTELLQHERYLSEMDDEMGSSLNSLEKVSRKVEKLLGPSGCARCKFWTIVVLCIVITIEFFLIIYA